MTNIWYIKSIPNFEQSLKLPIILITHGPLIHSPLALLIRTMWIRAPHELFDKMRFAQSRVHMGIIVQNVNAQIGFFKLNKVVAMWICNLP